MLETAICDICIRTGNIKKPKENTREFYRNYPPRKMINYVSKNNHKLKNIIHDFYTELSALIHRYKTIKKTDAKETLRKTAMIIEMLYKNWDRSLKSPVL